MVKVITGVLLASKPFELAFANLYFVTFTGVQSRMKCGLTALAGAIVARGSTSHTL